MPGGKVIAKVIGDPLAFAASASGLSAFGSSATLPASSFFTGALVAVYSEERFLVSHVYFAAQAYRQFDSGRFDTLDLRAATELEALGAPLAAAQERL